MKQSDWIKLVNWLETPTSQSALLQPALLKVVYDIDLEKGFHSF